MALDSCIYCSKLINYYGGIKLCKECDEKLFSSIKEYLIDNPGSSINDISDNTKISPKIISAYIKSGRIESINGNNSYCPLCGDLKDENSKYCLKCFKKIKVANELSNLYNEEKKETENKMRYMGGSKRR